MAVSSVSIERVNYTVSGHCIVPNILGAFYVGPILNSTINRVHCTVPMYGCNKPPIVFTESTNHIVGDCDEVKRIPNGTLIFVLIYGTQLLLVASSYGLVSRGND